MEKNNNLKKEWMVELNANISYNLNNKMIILQVAFSGERS